MVDIHWALSENTAPGAEPISTADAKSHLRVDVTADDTLIDTLVKAARKRFENDTNRALITQTWEFYLDRFPVDDTKAIKLPKAPLQSITSIKYIDTAGVEQTWANTKYRVDIKSEPGRITPAFSESYPTTRTLTNAVTITFVAGFGSAGSNVPDDIIHALKMLIGHWYENREAVQADVSVSRVPMAYKHLMMSHVIWDFG